MDELLHFLAPLLVIAIYLAIFLVPIAAILKKAGYSAGWVLAFAIPVVNVIALWVFAFSKWPVLRNSAIKP